MSTRHRKNHKLYAAHTTGVGKKKTCEFCKFTIEDDGMIEELQHFWVVANKFPYDVWDTSKVVDHLMLVPKRHVDSIAHFSADERKEHIDTVGRYEAKGYSIYSRAAGSAIKSVVHQHTHFIKIDNSLKKFILFMKKPRMLIAR